MPDLSLMLSIFISVTAACMAIAAAYHALMTKPDSKSAFAWTAFSLILPLIGPIIYLIFGINRIAEAAQASFKTREPQDDSESICEPLNSDLRPRSYVGEAITGEGLRSCEEILVLENGDGAYPAMLEDIDRASERVFCSTYIFQDDETGNKFLDAFKRAAARGVDVRILVDGLGGIAYPPIVIRKLRRSGLRFVLFNPIRLIPLSLHINLRNHRKILVVDGKAAYTGGQNIGDRHLIHRLQNSKKTRDLHFRLTGKIVDELERAFLKDWNHACGVTDPEPFTPSNSNLTSSAIWTRVIPDGPNDDLDKLTKLLLGVMSTAQQRIWIMTPYFLPSIDLIGALVAAELRGVDVKIMLPKRTNIHMAHWAGLHNLRHILALDLKVYLQPAPFIHTKAVIIDDNYSLIGSSNIDPRSLRLNYELMVEVFDRTLTAQLDHYFQQRLEESYQLNQEKLAAQPVWLRLRNAIAWLFSPYL